MSIDDLKKELEEVRKLKEELKEEISEIKSNSKRRRSRTISFEPPNIDLSGLTDSLDEMMQKISIQINDSFKGVKINARAQPKSEEYPDVESIPPERIARVINPLGSEERLFILDLLKTDSRTFNELEQYTGKTGSSLTHHLNPLQNSGYVIKGEVRGTYYITVEGLLAYRLAQWLTKQVENEKLKFKEDIDRQSNPQEGWL